MREQLGWRFSRRIRFNTSAAALGMALVYASNPTAAFAQDKSAGANDEIVVTAQFREQNLQDTPLAITAVNAGMLEARGQTNVRDIAAQAPNVSIDQTPAGYGAAAQVTIRGIGQTDSSLALEPGVGIYVDDVYYATVFGNVFDLLDLDRVEILRGPQGTLAGKNSIGGAIKLFSKKPSEDADGYVQVSYGSYNLASIKGASSFTIVPGQMWMRLSGSFTRRNGYVTNYDYECRHPGSGLPKLAYSSDCVIGHEGGGSDVGLRGVLRWQPSDKLEINIYGDYSKNDDEPTPNSLIVSEDRPAYVVPGLPPPSAYLTGDPYSTYATYIQASPPFIPPRKVSLQAWGVSGTIDYKFSDNVSFKSITAYREHSGDVVQDTDASPLSAGLTANPISVKQFTQELRVNANIANALDLTVGGYYFDGSGVNAGRILAVPLEILLHDTQSSTNYSAFAHAVWSVNDRLHLTGGIRYSKEEKHFTFGRVDPYTLLPSCAFGACAIDGTEGVSKAQRVDYRAVIDYRWSDQLMTYAQFSTGFKGGGVNPRPYYQNQVAPFGPEAIKAWEVGIKSDLLDHKLRLNLSAFYNVYSGIQLKSQGSYFNPNLPVQPDPSKPFYNPVGGTFPSAVTFNAGTAHVKGVEAEFTLKPTQGLTIDGSVSYLDFKYTKLLPEALAGGIKYGMVTPYTPKWKASLGIQYEIDMGNAGSLTPRVDYNYQSSMYAYSLNGPYNVLADRNMFNARLTYKTADDNWEAALAVTNLTNTFYYTSKFDFYNIQGLVTGVPVRPREWQVSVKRRF